MQKIHQEVAEHFLNTENNIEDALCSGYPYLRLKRGLDYNLKATNTVYADCISLIKTHAEKDTWEDGRVSFFDIHPVFSNAQPITGLLGLHLSLKLMDKGLVTTYKNLYFDTMTNWYSFTKPIKEPPFHLASWIRFDSNIVFQQSEDLLEQSPYCYTRTCINLVRGSDLSDLTKTPPTDFSQKLLSYYQKHGELDVKGILNKHTAAFLKYSDYLITKFFIKSSSVAYLFLLIFFREFGLKLDLFKTYNTENGYSFIFEDDDHILSVVQNALNFIDQIKLEIGEYPGGDYNYSQCEVDEDRAPKKTGDKNELSNPFDSQPAVAQNKVNSENLKFTDLVELSRSYITPLPTAFFEAPPPLELNEILEEMFSVWRDLVFCFMYENLTQADYNKLRVLVTPFIKDQIVKSHLLDFKKLTFQQQALKTACFELFNLVTGESYKRSNKEVLEVTLELFNMVQKPKLSNDQELSKNLLNSDAQKTFLENIDLENCYILDSKLVQCVGVIAHPNLRKGLGSALKDIDSDMLKKLITTWYFDNYISRYLEINNEYAYILEKISEDIDRFTNDSLIQISILNEVKTFVKLKRNPFEILNLDLN